MKKITKTAIASALALTLTACSSQGSLDNEIQIPIYQPEQLFSTTTVQRMDLAGTQTVAGSIGYALSDALSTAHDGNLISINVNQYQELKEGDVIAVIDSSALDYTYLEQKIMTESAYNQYLATGSEVDRLTYEYQKSVLDAIQYEIDSYTITAPYDCVVSDVSRINPGEELSQGTYICSVAHPEDIYVYVGVDPDSNSPFQLGSKVKVTLTGSTYEGTVVSFPKSTSYKYGREYVLQNNNDYVLQNMGWGGWNDDGTSGNSGAANASKNAIIGFAPDVLDAMLTETPNAVVAGWATLTVTTERINNVLCVPSSAVKIRDASYVYLYKNGQKLQIPVQTGSSINGYTVIISGLKEGDTIII